MLLLGGCSNYRDILAIKGTWEPLSTVYLNFGNMVVRDDSIAWTSGQKVSFRIARKDKNGIVVELTDKALPEFHGTTYKFIRFNLKYNTNFKKLDLKVSFYEPNRDLNDNNAMWGVYVRPEADEILDTLTEVTIITETEQMKADLEKWEDARLIAELSKMPLTEKEVKQLYREFKSTIVRPPEPEKYKEYSIENAEESLIKVEALGKKMHNLFLALSKQDFAKYGKLVGIMRDTLYIDWQNIPYAIRHSNARDIYWHGLHAKGVDEAQKEFQRLFLG